MCSPKFTAVRDSVAVGVAVWDPRCYEATWTVGAVLVSVGRAGMVFHASWRAGPLVRVLVGV